MGNEFDSTLGHYVEMCSKLGIFLDFDGTLSPLARTPELAFIPPETKKVRFPKSTIIFICRAQSNKTEIEIGKHFNVPLQYTVGQNPDFWDIVILKYSIKVFRCLRFFRYFWFLRPMRHLG